MPTNYWLKFGNSACVFNGKGVQFTHVEQPGSLTVTLNGTGTGFDPDKVFTVNVAFGSAISYTVDGVPVQSPSASYSASLKSGESVVLGNIPFGTTYSITETIAPADAAYGYSTGTVTNGSGTMTDAGAITATANYTYGNVLPDGIIRFRFADGEIPRAADPGAGQSWTWTQVASSPNVWDLDYDRAAFDLGWRNTAANYQLCTWLHNHPFEIIEANCSGLVLSGGTGANTLGAFKEQPVTKVGRMHHVSGGISQLFRKCESLTEIDSISTSGEIPHALDAFNGCKNLKSVPLFNTPGIYQATNMFAGCYKVESGALAMYNQLAAQAPADHDYCFYACGRNTASGAAELAQIPSDWK